MGRKEAQEVAKAGFGFSRVFAHFCGYSVFLIRR